MASDLPPFAECVCLALIDQQVNHGWALKALLAPGGEIGRVWNLSRPLTYRAIEGLVDKGLVTRAEVAGPKRSRLILALTPAGRRVVDEWLERPVEHLRDVRTELLVKLLLRTRAGRENRSILARQAAQFEATIDALSSTSPNDDLVDLWRRESARAVRRFLAQATDPADQSAPARPELRIGAANQLHGTVTRVHYGEVMSTISTVLGDGQRVTAALTTDEATNLDLAPGDAATLVVRATEVLVAVAVTVADVERVATSSKVISEPSPRSAG